MRRVPCLVLLLLLVPCAFADAPARPREDGKVVLRLGGLPTAGTRGWEEYARVHKLNPDIKLKSVTGITVEGITESKLTCSSSSRGKLRCDSSTSSPIMTHLVMAALTIASIPTLLVFLFCQNIIMRGIVLPTMKY